MRYLILFIPLFIFSCRANKNMEKVKLKPVDRYNYIQKPTDKSVTIAWVTKAPSNGQLRWGTTPNQLLNSIKDSILTQKHVFELIGLIPNTKYYYQTNAITENKTQVDSFYTAKRKTNTDFSFLHYGDCGTGKPVQETIGKLMEKETVDFGLVTGDVDQGNGFNYDEVFFQKYKNMLSHNCHYTAIGNHDGYYNKASTYLDAFHLPVNNGRKPSERYYSFTWGDAKFICLDSNYGRGVPKGEGVQSDAQKEWLEKELQCNDKKWIFIYFHHPAYTVAWTGDYYLPIGYLGYKGSYKKQKEWMDLFDKYNVDFVLTGHSHCYQRGEYKGTQFVLSGGAGTSDDAKFPFWKGIDQIHVKKDSIGKRLKRKVRRTPKDSVYINGQKVEEYYEVPSIFPTVDVLIRQSQFVRFDVQEDSVTFTAINDKGQTIDIQSVYKKTKKELPNITIEGKQLKCYVGNSHNWFLDGIQVSGISNSTIPLQGPGIYEVEISDDRGCKVLSEAIEVKN